MKQSFEGASFEGDPEQGKPSSRCRLWYKQPFGPGTCGSRDTIAGKDTVRALTNSSQRATVQTPRVLEQGYANASDGTVGRRTLVLVFSEERIQQRDQDCEIETAFIRRKVRVEDHTGELGVSCVQWAWLRLLICGQFSKWSLANHLEVSAGDWSQPLSLGPIYLLLQCHLQKNTWDHLESRSYQAVGPW